MLPILLLAAFALVVECYLLGRKGVFPILLASLFALFVTSINHYEYAGVENIYIGQLNLYPLVCWTAGLVILKFVYDRVRLPHKTLTLSAAYLVILFCVEYAAYYWLHIRTVGDYPSLLGLGVIHGTAFIHFFYVLAGPVYIAFLSIEEMAIRRDAKIFAELHISRK